MAKTATQKTKAKSKTDSTRTRTPKRGQSRRNGTPDPKITGQIVTASDGSKQWPPYVKVYLDKQTHAALAKRAATDKVNLPTAGVTLVSAFLSRGSFPRTAPPTLKRGDGVMVNLWMPAALHGKVKDAAKKRQVSPTTFCVAALKRSR